MTTRFINSDVSLRNCILSDTNFHNKQILQETIKRVFISLFVCLNMFQFTIHISKLLNKLINNFYEF